MTEITSLNCPNCGGNVSGEGEVKCEYCGSQLSIRQQPPATQTTQAIPQYIVTFSQSENTIAFFNDLPGQVIAIDTTNIPFKPEISYTNLPGGKLTANQKTDADEIVAIVKKIQDAVNSENIDEYMSTFSQSNTAHFEQVKHLAQQQFVMSDLKRYTTNIDFVELSADKAILTATNESLTFPVAGAFERLEVMFRYQLQKSDGRWKVVMTSLEKNIAKASTLGKKLAKIFWILFILIFVITLGAVCISLGGSFCGVGGSLLPAIFGSNSDSIEEMLNKPENDEAVGRTVQVDKERLVLYAEPTTFSERLDYINSGILVVIVESRDGNWVHVQLADGDEGWAAAKVDGDYIDGISGDSTSPAYDATGASNAGWVGRQVTVGPERVKLRMEPNASSRRVAYVSKGEKLDVLETGDDFWMRMKNEKGDIGWGRVSFVGNHVNGKDY